MKENKMKPKRTQRHTGPSWQGKGVSAGDKATLSQAKPTSLVSSRAQVTPFAGKVFYLDLPSNRTAETLESDIKDLGGTVEKFFSKDIKYLVSNKREARYVQCLRQDSPVPSPDSGPLSSPHPPSKPHRPGSQGDNMKSRSQGQTDTFVTSRGKSLVERVVKEQERVRMNKMLSNALEWGVKILYVDDIIAYVQKKKKTVSSHCSATVAIKTKVKTDSVVKQGFQKYKGGRISKPFVKVEDSSRHYRPVYVTMSNMPEFNLQTAPPCTPFCVEDKDPPGNKQRGNRGVKASQNEEKVLGRKKNRDKKRGGYCECCMVKYENVTAHLQGERHKSFSRSDEYSVVDKLVSTLHSNFIPIRAQVKRPKCSVSSPLTVPGPCGKAKLRHKGDVDTAETFKEEQHPVVEGREASYSGHTLKIGSVPVLASVTHGEGHGRSCSTHADTAKHKSLACKWPCRQNSLTSCTEKAPHPRMETAPSRGEGPPSSACRVTQPDPGDPERNGDGSSLTFRFSMNRRNETSSNRTELTTPQEANRKQDFSVYDFVDDDDETLPDKVIENNFLQKDDSSPPSQFSPVRKIKRRTRVYKRKRRKLDAQVEHVKQNNTSDDSVLKVCELFQSSENLDVEFKGFEESEADRK
ncbi:uncharacterized protein V6R79_005460 [Siganus canaliculatus]